LFNVAAHTSTARQYSDIRQADNAFYDAWTSRDLYEMGQVWRQAPYVSAIHPAGTDPFIGWDNVKESWHRAFGHNRDININRKAGTLHVRGDVAWLIDWIRYEAVQTQTGQPILMPGLIGTKILEKVDGQWRVVHYHLHLPGFAPFPQDHAGLSVATNPRGTRAEQLRKAAGRVNLAATKGDWSAYSSVWAHEPYVSAILPDARIPIFGWERVKQSSQESTSRHTHTRSEIRYSVEHDAGAIGWVVQAINYYHQHHHEAESYRHMETHSAGWNTENVLVTEIFEKSDNEWRLVHYHSHRGPP